MQNTNCSKHHTACTITQYFTMDIYQLCKTEYCSNYLR